MVIFMSKSSAPGPIDTAEAFLDAILRNDKKTLEAISNIKSIPANLINKLKENKGHHNTIGQKYDLYIKEDKVTNDSSLFTLELILPESKSIIEIKLIKNLNRWIISNIRI